MPTEIERLYREHRAGLVRLVERELRDHDDAEDVVQTAFLDAQRALERGTIPHNPPAWLATIALNAGRRLRRRRLNAEPLEEYAVQEAARMPEIREALASLPKTQRAAVVYRDVAGLSYDETAEKLGTSVNAVTMLLHRGRSKLRHALGIAVGGFGLWRWLKRAGMPQVAIAKGSAAVVVAAGLATGGIVAAREVAPIGAATNAAVAAVPSGSRAHEAGRAAESVAALDAARRSPVRVGASSVIAIPGSTEAPGAAATPASVVSSTSDAPLPPESGGTTTAPPIPTLPSTVAATVAVSTPVTTVSVTTPTVTVPTVTTVTVTTPIVTVTLPIP